MEDLSLKNIKNFLTKNKFPASDAEQLGLQLDEVPTVEVEAIKRNHGFRDWNAILIDIINHWLKNDVNQSWKKLGEALYNCGHKMAASKLGVYENDDKKVQPIITMQEKSKSSDVSEQARLRKIRSDNTSDESYAEGTFTRKEQRTYTPPGQSSNKNRWSSHKIAAGVCGLILIAGILYFAKDLYFPQEMSDNVPKKPIKTEHRDESRTPTPSKMEIVKDDPHAPPPDKDDEVEEDFPTPPTDEDKADIIASKSPPSWFTSNTQLCFRWRADGRSSQCGDHRETAELCANVGTYTTNYRDDTDGRSGGCRMQWSIKSPSADEQFRGVQICYRWAADGDSGQCEDGTKSPLCAPVGSYTSEYRDDTDGRGGGCQMSWMLSVPEGSPQWLKDVQLCYRWFPDGEGGQCGGQLQDREVCARANNWTPYYRDDTDGRGGGCQMAWKLT